MKERKSVAVQQFSVWKVFYTFHTENASNRVDLPSFAKKMKQILNLEVFRLPNLELLVAVIGAGFGGLSAAIRLAAQGWKVEVYEQQSYAGGHSSE
jgi:heterodisulfide reductase subunit A-like polyferredoxin